jgi:hypothetical protein
VSLDGGRITSGTRAKARDLVSASLLEVPEGAAFRSGRGRQAFVLDTETEQLRSSDEGRCHSGRRDAIRTPWRGWQGSYEILELPSGKQVASWSVSLQPMARAVSREHGFATARSLHCGGARGTTD